MLRYLTHKLRTQSLAETDTYDEKTDDDHDSGTESDDEGADIEELQKYMESIIHLDGPGIKPERKKTSQGEVTMKMSSASKENNYCPSGLSAVVRNSVCCQNGRRLSRLCQNSRASTKDAEEDEEEPDSPIPEPALDSALPSDSDHNFDHHSSEEELEVINGEVGKSPHVVTRHQARSAAVHQHPEKRKWSQANHNHQGSLEDGVCTGGSSSDDDDEVRELMWCDVTMAPVEFRTSPPANVHKPRKCLSPPPKVFHLMASVGSDLPPHELCSLSPRKRHRRTPTAVVLAERNIQRPCLDFEKMQQINRVRLQ